MMGSGERAGGRETGDLKRTNLNIFIVLFQRCTGERHPVGCMSPQRIAGLATYTSHEN